MNTSFLLMAQYNGLAVIPIGTVAKDYFPHLNQTALIGKIGKGEIKLPMVRMEHSQKSAKGVHLQDLAEFIDARREAAQKEMRQLTE